MEAPVQVFGVPRLGHAEEEYEDAAAHAVAHGRFAIADGATDSSYADRWARALTERFVADPPGAGAEALGAWLAPLQAEWHASIPWDRLPWWAEEKARLGAFATLLGLRFSPRAPTASAPSSGWRGWWRQRFSPPADGGDAQWQALAVGDSCLFQVRKETLVRAFPRTRSDGFHSRPGLLSTHASRLAAACEAAETAEGDARPGDLFLLCTDALAHWFLTQHEVGFKPWRQFATLETRDDFAALVDRLRRAKALKNDDTTLLRFQWPT